MVILVLNKDEVALLRFLSQYEINNSHILKTEDLRCKLNTIIVKLDNAL